MFGFLNINKPAGPTSHDVVDHVRRLVGKSFKTGHSGTLDPFADGVLVICVGQATRLAGYVQRQPKRYLARIVLGATSTTDDPEGRITARAEAPLPSAERVDQVLRQFVGSIQQVPPAHSAALVNGRRAYRLARAGQQVDLPARTVEIASLEALSYAWPYLEVDVACGTGTYIRSLARDVGAALGVGGYCDRLTRRAVGDFTLDSAIRPADLDPPRHLQPALLAVARLPRLVVTASAVQRLAMGNSLDLAGDAAPCAGIDPAATDPVEAAVVDEGGQLLAIATVVSGQIVSSKVFIAG